LIVDFPVAVEQFQIMLGAIADGVLFAAALGYPRCS